MKKASSNNLRTVPHQIPGPSTESTDEHAPLFFFKPDEEYGEFCQWYPAKFTISKAEMSDLVGHPIDEHDPEGWEPICFNCAELFMMYCKAGRFHYSETQKLILATRDPKEQKRPGRLTKGFQAASWDEIKSQVVVAGNMAKFSQNKCLKELLMGTGGRVLAEAASQDNVWGIGFTAKEALALGNPELWEENRLGKALMIVREHLQKEDEESSGPWPSFPYPFLYHQTPAVKNCFSAKPTQQATLDSRGHG